MDRTPLPANLTPRQLAEIRRQGRDPRRRIHAQAYRFIQTNFNQGAFPTKQELRQWLEDNEIQLCVSQLTKGMVDYGWLEPHGHGYRLRTQLDLTSIIDNLIQAHDTQDAQLWQEIKDLYERHHKGTAG